MYRYSLVRAYTVDIILSILVIAALIFGFFWFFKLSFHLVSILLGGLIVACTMIAIGAACAILQIKEINIGL